MSQIGEALDTLRRGGYTIRAITRDGIHMMEYIRGPDVTLARPVGDRIVLGLMRRQDEVLAYWIGTGADRERLRAEIMACEDGRDDALVAAKIAHYNLLLGYDRSSTGERWEDVRNEYMRDANISGAI